MLRLTACKISFGLSFLDWVKNEVIFYRISELMLPIKNHFISRTRAVRLCYNNSFLLRGSCHFVSFLSNVLGVLYFVRVAIAGYLIYFLQALLS